MSKAMFGALGMFGKHPTRDDFLALGNRAREFTSFDAFLTHNVEWAEAKVGSPWVGAYGTAGLQAFVYRPTSGGRAAALVGVFAPSWDRAGRRFPLTLAVPLSAPAKLLAAPEVLPLVLEPYWHVASEQLLGLTSDPYANLEQAMGGFSLDEVALEEAFTSYGDWTAGMPASELWALIFGADRAVDPVGVLGTVSETVATCRDVERPSSPLALRLPLGGAGGAAVCFWLDWVRTIARWKTTLPSFFWSHDGQQGTMILALGNPPACTLGELWCATGNRDQVCDVAMAPEATARVDTPLGHSLAAELDLRCSVAELLHVAHRLEL